MPNATETLIKNRIAEFVQELELLVKKSTLESLQAILTNGSRPARRGPGRPAGVTTGSRGRPRADLGDAAERIVAHVRANDGQGISTIAEATGIDLKTAKKAAIKLLASGALKKSGQKRGTVYHVGGGRKRRAKAGKRSARRAKRATKAKSKPRAAPRRKVRAAKKAVVIPAPKRLAPAPKVVRAETDVPQALAVG